MIGFGVLIGFASLGLIVWIIAVSQANEANEYWSKFVNHFSIMIVRLLMKYYLSSLYNYVPMKYVTMINSFLFKYSKTLPIDRATVIKPSHEFHETFGRSINIYQGWGLMEFLFCLTPLTFEVEDESLLELIVECLNSGVWFTFVYSYLAIRRSPSFSNCKLVLSLFLMSLS